MIETIHLVCQKINFLKFITGSSAAQFSYTRAQIFKALENTSGSTLNEKLSAFEIHISNKTNHCFTFEQTEKENVRKMLNKSDWSFNKISQFFHTFLQANTLLLNRRLYRINGLSITSMSFVIYIQGFFGVTYTYVIFQANRWNFSVSHPPF